MAEGSKSAIVIRLQDGLGNQMFQYALGQSLAARLGVPLEFDSSWYGDAVNPVQRRSLTLREFAVRGTFSPAGAHSHYWLRDGVLGSLWWRVEQRLLPLRWRRFVEQRPGDFLRRGRMFDPAILEVRPGTYLSGWWISPHYFAGAEAILRRDLTLRVPLTPAARRWVEKIRAQNAVAVHIRRGDYLRHPEIGVLPASYYARAVNELRRRVPDAKFFLFSDELPAARETLRDITETFEGVQLEPDANPAQDLAVMASCRHFIIANSTFSWWGAWLGQSTDKIVIAPSRWYVGARLRISDVYPSEWIEVPC